jgi:hypothetical protein
LEENHLTDLTRPRSCQIAKNIVNAIFANRRCAKVTGLLPLRGRNHRFSHSKNAVRAYFRSRLFSTRHSHTLECQAPAHDGHKTAGNSQYKANEYRFKPSRGVGYRGI